MTLSIGEYTISEREYVRAYHLSARLSKKQIIIFMILAVVLVIVAYVAGGSSLKGTIIGGLIGATSVYSILRFLVHPLRTKSLYRNYAAIKEPCTIKLEEDGIRFKSKSGEFLLEWKLILKWRENEELVLIYQAPHLYHLVPKRTGAFAESLIEALANNVGLQS